MASCAKHVISDVDKLEITLLLCDKAEAKICVKTTCHYMNLLKQHNRGKKPQTRLVFPQKGKLMVFGNLEWLPGY